MPFSQHILLEVVGPKVCYALRYVEFPIICEEDSKELCCMRREFFHRLVLVARKLRLREEDFSGSCQQNVECSWRDLEIVFKFLLAIFSEVSACAEQHGFRTHVVNLALDYSLPFGALQQVVSALAIYKYTLHLLHRDF